MRAFFVVVCFVAFYALAIGAIVAASYVGVMVFGWMVHVHGKGLIALGLLGGMCFVAAGVIAWSILPRVDRFTPPGPELKESEHPRLFAMIREVALAAGQPMPRHVYAVLDANAFVAERGGVMGIGSTRVMGIGMALLHAFSIDEIRAVIAHEFGHFYGGDTKLGPWIYKTRAAMGRTITNLYKSASKLSEVGYMVYVLIAIAAPFRWLGIGYVRLSQSISRRQEYSADALAARIVGAEHLISGFRKLAGVSEATDVYLRAELTGLLDQRVAPPFFAGLSHFLAEHKTTIAEVDADHLKTGEIDPYDSHPPISKRIEALERFAATRGATAASDPAPEAPRAESLLERPELVAHQILEHLVGHPLERVEWEATGEYLKAQLRTSLQSFATALAPKPLRELCWDDAVIAELLRSDPELASVYDQLPDEILVAIARRVFVQAFQLALCEAGYELVNRPGKPLMSVSGDRTIDVASVVDRHLAGELQHAELVQLWVDAGVADQPWRVLSSPVPERRAG
jgi:heat shock protein HtpX